MRKSLFSLSLLTSLTLVSCSTILNNLPGVYTLEIQQGNIIDQAMIDQLRPGMNKRQVLYIMGSPMLDDVFHKNRWDYLYSDQPDGEDRVQKQISLFFENDQIVGIQGDFRPSAVPVIKTSGETTVDVPKRDLEKTLWEKITGLIGYDELDAIPETDKTDAK
jgi:outer membrane protein assembly factor BamE